TEQMPPVKVYDQIHHTSSRLMTNNSRFLILPDWHCPTMARILSLCQKRLPIPTQALHSTQPVHHP
ncbi:MAG: hypothetical protein SV375_01280, partial [Thermodesulfobacteriota bacterium]|nr:hypothetical protein [Thermodesulfobacteriota bacterium]